MDLAIPASSPAARQGKHATYELSFTSGSDQLQGTDWPLLAAVAAARHPGDRHDGAIVLAVEARSHDGQRPIHFGDWKAHCWHTKEVFGRGGIRASIGPGLTSPQFTLDLRGMTLDPQVLQCVLDEYREAERAAQASRDAAVQPSTSVSPA